MPTHLYIPESQIPRVKPVFEALYAELLGKLQPLQEELRELEPTLIQLGIIQPPPQAPLPQQASNQITYPIQSDGYNPSWKWLTKIEFVIENAKRPLTSIEIIDEIILREPGESRARLMNSVPATLSVAYKEGKIERASNGKGEYVYDLKEDLPF